MTRTRASGETAKEKKGRGIDGAREGADTWIRTDPSCICGDPALTIWQWTRHLPGCWPEHYRLPQRYRTDTAKQKPDSWQPVHMTRRLLYVLHHKRNTVISCCNTTQNLHATITSYHRAWLAGFSKVDRCSNIPFFSLSTAFACPRLSRPHLRSSVKMPTVTLALTLLPARNHVAKGTSRHAGRQQLAAMFDSPG